MSRRDVEAIERPAEQIDHQTLQEVWLPLYCAALQGLAQAQPIQLGGYTRNISTGVAKTAAWLADDALDQYLKREK